MVTYEKRYKITGDVDLFYTSFILGPQTHLMLSDSEHIKSRGKTGFQVQLPEYI